MCGWPILCPLACRVMTARCTAVASRGQGDMATASSSYWNVLLTCPKALTTHLAAATAATAPTPRPPLPRGRHNRHICAARPPDRPDSHTRPDHYDPPPRPPRPLRPLRSLHDRPDRYSDGNDSYGYTAVGHNQPISLNRPLSAS